MLKPSDYEPLTLIDKNNKAIECNAIHFTLETNAPIESQSTALNSPNSGR
jgi:hypothetical protein